MVKLASARETRVYGPRRSRNRSEYINAGLYIFATILLASGFAAQFSSQPKSGLVLLLIGFAILMIVNLHDLIAHLAGIDFRLPLIELDMQLALVELAVPLVYSIGTILLFLATLFILIQAEKNGGHFKLERAAISMLVAGPALWLLGSIHNSCQIYEMAHGHVQIMQESVLIPFLMSSLLFLVGAVLNTREDLGHGRHGLELLGEKWVWFGIVGSLILFIGGLANVFKVFKMQENELRLEKFRGGAQQHLMRIMDQGYAAPLVVDEDGVGRREEEGRLNVNVVEEAEAEVEADPTPYKDVLVGTEPM